jgi:hypothetical protein
MRQIDLKTILTRACELDPVGKIKRTFPGSARLQNQFLEHEAFIGPLLGIGVGENFFAAG